MCLRHISKLNNINREGRGLEKLLNMRFDENSCRMAAGHAEYI
jgi:hypothetical protein